MNETPANTPATAPATAGPDNTLSAYADHFDGARSRVQRVALTVFPDRLEFAPGEGRALVWRAEELRAVPDQAAEKVLVLSKAGDKLARLVIADETVVGALRANAPALAKRPPVEHKGRILGWGLGAIASVALIIFVLVPLMANQLAAYLPPEGEKALGDATFEQIRTALGDEDLPFVETCEDPAGLAALDAMVARLDPDDDLPYPLEITVLDHELVNAFALPGGHVVLFRGLIEEASGPDEVAAVLAHEIGHVVNRDPTRDALRLAGSFGVLGLLFGDFAGGTVVLLAANQLINAKYSQAAESGADDYAHALLTDAGIPPSALGTFFERVMAEHGDAEGISAHFSSHPQMRARIEAALAAEGEGAAGTTPALAPRDWQALWAICGGAEGRALPGGHEKAPSAARARQGEDG